MTKILVSIRIAIAALAVVAIAVACGADASDAGESAVTEPLPTTAAAALAEPADGVAASVPTSAGTALAVPDGAAVYQQYCAECHGVDLRGTDKGPSQLSIIYEPNHHGDYAYRVAIRDGTREHHWWFGDMPPVEGITDLEIEKVISFIRAEQQRLGFEQ